MKHIINATLVSIGLSVASSAAWAQFAPTMDAAAVKAQVQKQLNENASIEAIINAATEANISPESLIQALTSSVPKDKLEQVVALLAKQFANNQPALNVLAASAQGQGLSADQARNIIAANIPGANFALAGLGGSATPTSLVTPVNSLFNSNSPVSGSGSGAPASAN
jgi:hypothetical protein